MWAAEPDTRSNGRWCPGLMKCKSLLSWGTDGARTLHRKRASRRENLGSRHSCGCYFWDAPPAETLSQTEHNPSWIRYSLMAGDDGFCTPQLKMVQKRSEEHDKELKVLIWPDLNLMESSVGCAGRTSPPPQNIQDFKGSRRWIPQDSFKGLCGDQLSKAQSLYDKGKNCAWEIVRDQSSA